MKRYLVFFIIILFFAECNRYKKTIPKDDFIKILADIHLADATLEISGLKKFRKYDTVVYHDYILKKYGYTKAEFDSTITYYVHHLRETQDLYDKVIAILKQESMMLEDTTSEEKVERQNLWELKNSWNFPEDGSYETLGFTIPVQGKGKYTFEADIKMYSDDESENPRLNIYFYKPDTINNYGSRIYFNSVLLEKDDMFNKISVSKILTDTSFKSVKGNIISFTNIQNVNMKRHAEIRDMAVYYDPETDSTLMADTVVDSIYNDSTGQNKKFIHLPLPDTLMRERIRKKMEAKRKFRDQ